MSKRKKPDGKKNLSLTNYKDAWFVFPEGSFRVVGRKENPAVEYEQPPEEQPEPAKDPVLPSRSVDADDTYEALIGILQDAYTLLKQSNEPYSDIIDWMIHDLNLVKNRKD